MSKIAKSALQVLVFVAFFPYPAITQFGSATGVQLYEILAVIIVCLTLPKLVRAKSTLAFLILMSPVLMSLGAPAFLGGGGDVDLAIRVVLMLLPSLSILPAGSTLMRHVRTEWLVTPVSVAICIHAFVGVWQYRVFAQGAFPLLPLFRNPSFSDLRDISTTYALYTTRPFGLFPEPSAMAAAVGPWILFLLWYGLRPEGRGRTKALVGAGAGTLLILLSQSIYAVFLLPCAFLILLLHRRASLRRVSTLELLAWGLSALGVFLFFPILVTGRLGFAANDSTQGRLESLINGVGQPFKSVVALLLGIGPGQTAAVFSKQGAGVTAIYSIVVSEFTEGGLIALVAVILVWRMSFPPRSPGYRHVIFFAWFAGIAFTTSYVSLAPIWLFLAMMLDLEFDSESSARDPEFGLGRSRTTFDLFGESSKDRRPIEH